MEVELFIISTYCYYLEMVSMGKGGTSYPGVSLISAELEVVAC